MQSDLFETMYGVDEPTRNPQYLQPQAVQDVDDAQDWLRRHLAGRGAKRNTDGSMHIEIKGVRCRYWFKGNMLIKEQFVSAGAHKGWLPVARYYTLSYYKALKVLSRSWL